MSTPTIWLDTSPLQSGHAIRGVGMYTRLLENELKKHHDITLIKQSDKSSAFKPDLVHYPYFDLFFDTLPVFKVAPTVVTIHDVIPLLYPDFYPVGLKGKLRFSKQQFALNSVSAVITDSEASKTDIVKYLKVSPEKVYITYLAANPDLHVPGQEILKKVRKEYHLPHSYILYVGDINYNKNILQLIKALSYLPDDLHLVCVGKNFYPHAIPEWQRIETQLAASNVEQRVHFLTELASDQTDHLAAIYAQAEVYVQPSLYEGFGLPVLEAMQCRTPVVASNTSSLIEVVGKHGLLVEPTAEGLSEGVKKTLALSMTARRQQVSAAYTWSQTFSWEKTAAETIKIYKQVLAQK